ncbi:MAG TPA: HAMP domain-containing sensor histidine kinase [Polyangiales bacterium]
MKRQDDPRGDADREAELSNMRARIAELEAELKVRDEFIVAAAHELRNPVSPLVLHTQRLANAAKNARDGVVSAQWLDEQLVAFQRRLARFLSALHRILDISRIHVGQIDLVLELLDLSELVREVAGGFERELAAVRSELTLTLEPSLPGMFDRVRVEQIVSNLLSNAIRYGNSGPIDVTLRSVDGPDDTPFAELVVIDRGIGIDESDHERIFERFQRGPSPNRAGFGVGLWIVRELCEAMGGSVSVRSRAGEGATFLVMLPTNSCSRAEAPRASARSADDS